MEAGRQVFSVDLLERYAAKGHGVITCMAAGNDVIVLGTSKGWVIRHDFGVGSSSDIDLSAGRPGESIHRVFVDPGGGHCIATVVSSGGADTFYTHAKWTKPRILNKLKGLVVNAVAWNRQQITEASTGEVILGTDNGQLHEIAVDEKDKKEKYIKLLFELTELPEAFTDLQMETTGTSNGTRYYVMAVTPTRLYSFTGIGLLDAVFASYIDRAVHFMELPGDIPNSELQFFIKQRRAIHFAWLSGAGIYYGGLNFGAQHSSPNGDVNFVENKALLDFSKLSEGGGAAKPSSLAVSEFHFLLLIGNKVKVVNRISEQIIEELHFDQTPESASRGILGLCSDASAGLFYAYDENSIFQVSVNDESRDMWKVYLDLKEYTAALANCRDPFQRDQVYLEQAEVAFSTKDFVRAASFYAKINYILSFEEITLKFISIGEQSFSESNMSDSSTINNPSPNTVPARGSSAASENPSLQITTHKLNGLNYLQWSQSVKMFVTGRGKMGYLTGTVVAPTSDDPAALFSWEIENAMLMAWLINSMEPEISQVHLFLPTAKDIWDVVAATYSNRGNPAQAFAVKNQLKEIRQSERDVTRYFNQLKTLWQELD